MAASNMTTCTLRLRGPATPRRAGLRALLIASVVLPGLVSADSARAQPAPPQAGATTPAETKPKTDVAADPSAAAGASPAQEVKAPAAPSLPMPVVVQSVPERILLEQAAYWRGQSQPKRAIQSLDRLLALGSNADALALLARAQMDDGQIPAAQKALERLRAEYRADPRIAEIENDLRVGQPDPAQLEEARTLAQQGRSGQAVQAYRQAFRGDKPPNRYASEYYQTLGGTSAGFEPAQEGLGRIVAADPRDARTQLAYAKLLSYQEGTRDESIERLTLLSRSTIVGEEADRALRQALQWLPDTADSLKAVETYAQRHPGDAQITEKLTLIRNPPQSPVEVGGQARVSGFDKMEKQLFVEADRDFQKALSVNGEDADATAGLGFLRVKQGRTDEGRTLLKRALELGPTDAEGIESTLKSLEPSAGNKGGAPAAGASEAQLREIRAEYARVSRLTQRGRYAEAEALLRRLGGSEPNWGYHLQMGGIEALAGKTVAAEASFRRALAMKPGNPAATIGLAGVLLRQGREREAEPLYAQVGDTRTVGRLRAERLRSQARGVTDPVAQAGLYRAAVRADPENPWLRLELARALLRQGRGAEARSVMLEVGSNGDSQAVEAAFYFAVEVNDTQRAAELVSRVAVGRRTPQMVSIQQRVAVRAEIVQAAQDGSRSTLRSRLMTLAATPDPSGARVEEIARTLVALNDRSGAADAVSTALATNPSPTLQQRLAYASALAAASHELEGEQLLAGLGQADFPRDQRQAVGAVTNSVAAAVADRLRVDGQYGEAAARLARRLEAEPTSPVLNMALARLYIARVDLSRAVAITQELLERNPADLDVRRAAVEALIAMDDLERADIVADEGVRLAPREARAYMISALVARQRDENGRVLQNLATARELISASGDRAAGIDPDANDPSAASLGVAAAPGGLSTGNGRDAFRPGPLALGPSGRVPDILGEAALTQADPLGRRIERDIATLQDEVAPQARAGLGFLGRSGEGGLSRLNLITAPLEASFSPGGVGRLRIQVTPTAIDGNTAREDANSRLLRFGTNPIRGAYGLPPGVAGAQTGEGVALNVAYSYRYATFDIGTTPIGFIKSNVVGGIELAPLLTPDLRLRVIGDRRAVINSVLSYGGARDPSTGLTWGGVVRNRGFAQMEWSPGRWFVYAGAGGGVVTGDRVRDNGFVEAIAGASYGLYVDGPQEFRVGLSVPYVSYAQNQNAFTFGNGGYFSPQNYVAIQVPLTWRDQPTENLTYKLAGAVGFQSFEQRSALIFPNDPSLQLLLRMAPTSVSTVAAGTRASGLSYAASAEFEYRVSDDWRLGGRAAFQRAGDYTEGSAVLFGRYLFNTVR